MGWLSNARRHEQLLSPAAPAAKTASRVSAAGLRAYDGDGDHLDRRAARPTERAARDAKPRGVLADSPFDVPGPMLSPGPLRKPRTKARMTTTKTSRSLEDENASLRDELARAREDLMAERARADALASRLEAVEMMAHTTAVVVPPARGGAARGTSSAPVEERAERRRNPFGTPPTKGAGAMGDDAEEDLAAARRLFANGAGVQAPGKDVARTPDRSRHSFDPFVRPAGSDRVVRVPSPTGGRMIQIRAR
jgi:hypothetical protein